MGLVNTAMKLQIPENAVEYLEWLLKKGRN
jgi:hypothetical protein